MKPRGLAFVATLWLFFGVMAVFAALFASTLGWALFFLAVGALYILAGRDLLRGRKWAWWASVVFLVPFWLFVAGSPTMLILAPIFYAYFLYPSVRRYFGIGEKPLP